MDKRERLVAFLGRLKAAPPTSSREEAFQLIETTLNQLEDEFTNIPFDPQRWRDDGRLYPPQADSRRDVPDRPDLVRYVTVAQSIVIRDNGAIAIIRGHPRRWPDIEAAPRDFEKPGADGRGVFD
jgi:hypothetical protein